MYYFRRSFVHLFSRILGACNTSFSQSLKHYIIKPAALPAAFVLSTFYNFTVKPVSLNLDLKRACDRSERSIIDLMTVLKRNVLQLSKEYRDCLEKQIEITQKGTAIGAVGEHWNGLTKYRVHAQEIKESLSNYEILLNSLGQLVKEQTSVSYLTNHATNIENINRLYKELTDFIIEEFMENSRVERRLMKVNKENILKTKK